MNYAVMVSVIMPVYNAGIYLEQAVAGVLNQTYADFELILVDDGSTDGSGAACDRYQESDERVRVIHQPNGGICHARNVGMQHARGKYIAFSDHDDEMLPECLEKTVAFAEEENLDVVRFIRRHEVICGSRVRSEHTKLSQKEVAGKVSEWKDYLKIMSSGYGVWAGIYRRDFIDKNKLTFDKECRYGYEDHIFTTACVMKGEKIGVFPECLYVWKQRKGQSTSQKVSEEALINRLAALLKWVELERNFWEKVGISETDKCLRTYMYTSNIMCELGMPGLNIKVRRKLLLEYKKKIKCQKMNFKAFCKAGCSDKIAYICFYWNMIIVFSALRECYRFFKSTKL